MPEFDDYSVDYSHEINKVVGFVGEDHDFFSEIKAHLVIELIERLLGHPSDISVLDVGCGIGCLDQILVQHVKSLDGVDTSRESISRAKSIVTQGNFLHYDGQKLPYEDDQFELVLTVCVMHHVRESKWQNFVSEMVRVLRPGGIVVIVEHNPFNPLTRLVVNRCPFDADAVLLSARKSRKLLADAGVQLKEQRYFMFLPFRHVLARGIERIIGRLPLGAQYYIAARKVPSEK
jgi:SAM-dependent methyltransferase